MAYTWTKICRLTGPIISSCTDPHSALRLLHRSLDCCGEKFPHRPSRGEIDMADESSLAGTWAYRSYLNQADHRPLGAGLFTFQTPTPTTLTGTLEMANNLVLDLTGTITPAAGQCPLTVAITGIGRPGTTAGWEYRYHASPAFHWPEGIGQAASLVGTVLRAVEHGGNPAGVTGSFIAVKLS
jgi:hypothetical protein